MSQKPPVVALFAFVSLVACTTVPSPRAAELPPAVSTANVTLPVQPASTPETSPAAAILPAGLCAVPGYLHGDVACDQVPALTHVVLLADLTDRTTAEALVAEYTGKLPPGYPMVLTRHELPLDREEYAPLARVDGGVRSLMGDVGTPPQKQVRSVVLRVVAGLFQDAQSAHKYQKDILGGMGSVHAVAGPPVRESGDLDDLTFERSRSVAVAISHPAPAYADADIQRLGNSDGSLNGQDAEKGWALALSRLHPACTVRAGQVFESDRATLYQQQRRFAPVVCENGSRAWTAWEATRLESVVKVESGGVFVYQITHVQCDMATIEKLPFVWGGPVPVVDRSGGGCGGPS